MDDWLADLGAQLGKLGEGCADNVPKLSDALLRMAQRVDAQVGLRDSVKYHSPEVLARMDFGHTDTHYNEGRQRYFEYGDARWVAYQAEWQRLEKMREKWRKTQRAAKK